MVLSADIAAYMLATGSACLYRRPGRAVALHRERWLSAQCARMDATLCTALVACVAQYGDPRIAIHRDVWTLDGSIGCVIL